MNIHIRPFNKTDTNSVVQLWHRCGLLRPWNDPYRDIERKLALGDQLFLVAVLPSAVVGSIMGGYEGHRGWINYMAVCPEYQRQGLGRQLVNDLEQRLFALGCPKINLQVRSDNQSIISFYESLGFADDRVTSLGKRLICDEQNASS